MIDKMLFILSKILYIFLNPLIWIVALLLLSIFNKNINLAKYSRISGIILLIVFTNPLLINLALSKWEMPPKAKDTLPLIEVGVVLGGITSTPETFTDQIWLNESSERLVEAFRLLNDKIIRMLIISGGDAGILTKTRSEGVILEGLSLEFFNKKQILSDTLSRNTRENAVEVARILKSENKAEQPILLITSAFHMPRAIRCFEKQGIQIVPFPVDFRTVPITWSPEWLIPSSSALSDWHLLLKEWVGLFVYRLFGYA